jgi:hypothetical protein
MGHNFTIRTHEPRRSIRSDEFPNRAEDTAGTAGLSRSLAARMFNILFVASWSSAAARALLWRHYNAVSAGTSGRAVHETLTNYDPDLRAALKPFRNHETIPLALSMFSAL